MLTELHQHFDAAGNPSGVTLVKREPEWTDDDRDRLLALAEYERGVCECGFHSSLTGDPANIFKPSHRVCPVCAGNERYARMLHEADEKHPKDQPARQQRPSDGRRAYMQLLPPEEAK